MYKTKKAYIPSKISALKDHIEHNCFDSNTSEELVFQHKYESVLNRDLLISFWKIMNRHTKNEVSLIWNYFLRCSTKKTMYIKCYYIKYKCIFKCRRATIRSKNLIKNSIKKFWLLQRKRIASTVLENKFIKLLAQEICCSP